MNADCTKRAHSVWTTCACQDCAEMRRRQHKVQRTGRYNRVTSAEAWERLDGMLAAGWSTHAIASATGICHETIQRVLTEFRRRGHRQAFGPHHSAAIVNAGAPTRGKVGVVGTRRRLRALAAIGYGVDALGPEIGISPMAVSVIRGGQTRSVTPTVARKVAVAYERLSMRIGPGERARVAAQEQGWPPPLAWDDDAIDDPKARPRTGPRVERYRHVDVIAVDEAVAGRKVRLTVHERREAVLRMRELGMSAREIGDRLGMTTEAARRLGSRAQRRITEVAA